MGANNSTRRVSFESDENDNITVVKGIRLSENVIKRMKDPTEPKQQHHTPSSTSSTAPTPTPPPLLKDVPPPFDLITSLPSPVNPILPSAPSASESGAAPPSQRVAEQPVTILPASIPSAGDSLHPQSAQPFASLPLPEFTAPCEPVAPPSQPAAEPLSPASVTKPVTAHESGTAAAQAIDEEALKKKITDELHKDFEQQRVKAEQDMQAWFEAEKARLSAKAQVEAQTQFRDEVSKIISAERAAVKENLQQTIIRERIATEDEKLRAQLFDFEQKAKQLEAKEADLKKQDAFYREQVARLEERSAQFYKVTTENYHKAADQVNAKCRRYEVHPVCADLQGQILACYKDNAGRTLNCSNIAALYLQCVNNAKENKLKTGG
ncbi:coiled-coil-helix-coiled-coil-helix domain containing 3a isoform X3 [Oryzias melastigma]|uniref:coiled-coil-helix-coiled-coil-helix domain containing 3a isoform X3 n=1 Tax=Oryzias melastigma TaxID=30732 RepID=UPI000CF80185|nr:coiled-coil-helix-coiled-coil-helix domain containing 3a isoform X3 [Oryzias melastigma]